MPLLGAKHYDPTGGAAVSKSCASLLAMTAIDTTNLRITFTAPANGIVLVRLRGTIHGATTFPMILLGVLDGSTVKGRQVPMGALKTTAVATAQLTQEALFTVSGLTPGNSYTYDAAYAVEVLKASTGIKYGGPNNSTTDDAMGGFVFEIWDAPNILTAIHYDPASAGTKATDTLQALTALDTANLRASFTTPAGCTNVLVRLRCPINGATTMPGILLGVLDGSTIKGRQSPIGGVLGTAVATTNIAHEASFIVPVTASTSYTWDAAWGVEIVLASTAIRYGGPNTNVTANDAWGGFTYEVWAV